MNIDQRLEALTRSVELLSQFQASHEANLDRLFELHTEMQVRQAEMQVKYDANFDRLFKLQTRNEETMAQLMESVNSLARIAHAHEQRISHLEDTQ